MELLSKQRKAKLEAHISLQNLAHNYRAIKTYTGDTRVCCVIKADAYGHGAWACARYLASLGADYFAVSSVAEAEEVRLALSAYGDKIGILILGYTLPADVDLLIRYHIRQAVFSEDYANALRDAIRAYQLEGTLAPDARLSVHIKLDTGMNRLGFRPETDTDTVARICTWREFDAEGIFSHFARSDTPSSPATEIQFTRFMTCLDALAEKGRTFPIRHICNSAAITNFPAAFDKMKLDMVRYGVELYGLKPSEETFLPADGLRPVMTLKTVVSHIHTVKKGESVGYGGTFTAEKDTRIGTLPIGYADGFIRAYANSTVRIHGHDVSVIGRICMDQCMVDLSDLPDAKAGDEVLLFGDGTQSADDIAARAGTIGYEVLCLIGKRVPRVYTT